MATPSDEAVCESCRRAIDVCGFCGERCGHEICYRCRLEALRETLPQPHGHGG
jgi:hypothetical protein